MNLQDTRARRERERKPFEEQRRTEDGGWTGEVRRCCCCCRRRRGDSGAENEGGGSRHFCGHVGGLAGLAGERKTLERRRSCWSVHEAAVAVARGPLRLRSTGEDGGGRRGEARHCCPAATAETTRPKTREEGAAASAAMLEA
ncbi:E3 ubiquitin-protein ligase RBBP6 [Crotalus adamanteus]|uniref:E3 ubiquitin-protein ligase RBBP6 n=1 Tax=Crotalus adamanteus TaxID=8729 RepID=A0AAW1BDJ2_CROAD